MMERQSIISLMGEVKEMTDLEILSYLQMRFGCVVMGSDSPLVKGAILYEFLNADKTRRKNPDNIVVRVAREATREEFLEQWSVAGGLVGNGTAEPPNPPYYYAVEAD